MRNEIWRSSVIGRSGKLTADRHRDGNNAAPPKSMGNGPGSFATEAIDRARSPGFGYRNFKVAGKGVEAANHCRFLSPIPSLVIHEHRATRYSASLFRTFAVMS